MPEVGLPLLRTSRRAMLVGVGSTSGVCMKGTTDERGQLQSFKSDWITAACCAIFVTASCGIALAADDVCPDISAHEQVLQEGKDLVRPDSGSSTQGSENFGLRDPNLLGLPQAPRG
jgi:hypothetical protein